VTGPVTGPAPAPAPGPPLAGRGRALLLRAGAAPESVDALVEQLLVAYAEPTRGYHDLRHLAEVLDHVDELADEAALPDAVRLAAWFHDAVYTATAGPGADEEASAQLAERLLADGGVDAATVAQVARLVRLTATHRPDDGDSDGAVLCDADLAVLARDPAGYADYVTGVRREYAHVPEPDFRRGRAAVLRDLAAAPSLFRTATGRRRWEGPARRNLTAELAELTRP
jgi:predicted metal-dependent HD superfamily phosphohydrolase